MPGFADPSELYAQPQVSINNKDLGGTMADDTCASESQKPPMPNKNGPPKPRRPPTAVAQNASFLKPTMTSKIRRASNTSQERSNEYVSQLKEKHGDECTF